MTEPANALIFNAPYGDYHMMSFEWHSYSDFTTSHFMGSRGYNEMYEILLKRFWRYLGAL